MRRRATMRFIGTRFDGAAKLPALRLLSNQLHFT